MRAKHAQMLHSFFVGPVAGSSYFNDCVVGEEMAHAGVYIMLIKESLDRIAKNNDDTEAGVNESRKCLSVLQKCAPLVMRLLVHSSPEATSHVDPRPTIAEAWFLTLISLVSICQNDSALASSLIGIGVEKFFGESLSLAIALIFLKDLGTKKDPARPIQIGLSLDGPHTLAILSYISESVLLGPSILAETSILSIIQLSQSNFGSRPVCGPAILMAALLRSISGALPPWIVEEAPALFRSIFIAMEGDIEVFVQNLRASTKLTASASFGGIRSGELLAGKYLDASDSHIESLLSQTKEVCNKGNWQKMKVILKATCGGKKKDSGFNLKPQFNTWSCDRL